MDQCVDDLVRRVAADFVRQRGAAAFSYLNERAEIALDVLQDIASAITWWEIAITAVELSYARR
jgi:hypothetical protein